VISVSADVFLHDSKRLSIAATEIAETAEAAGLIPALNERLVLAICRQLVDWREAAIDRPISMEMSRAQLLDEQLVRLLSARFRDSGLHADRLELRLDHGMLWDETDHRLRTVLQHLSDLGVILSASGVGEGQFAFGDLGRLPITSIDLAPGMAASIGRCKRAERVLRGLITFMHDLGLRVRAVGICSREQLDFLQHHRCNEVAGPLFAPAMEGQDIDRMTGFKPCFRQQDKPSLSASRIVSMH
jgi:EAL domain-containing protein (putative c-di-GMP-specific phosphodiesterase class I)